MFGRISQRLELILEDFKIGQWGQVREIDNVEEQQSSIHTMSEDNFQRRLLAMKNHLSQLIELLVIGASMNIK